MLSEIEIEDYYNSVYPHFISQNDYKVKMEENWLKTYCLMNQEMRIMGISKNPMTIRSLANIKCSPAYSFYMRNVKDYNIWVEKNKSWKFIQDMNTHTWRSDVGISSIENLKEYILLNQKICLLDKIYQYIEYNRNEFSKILEGQESIYIVKYLESKEIIENNITEDKILKYPYTTGYANLCGISLQESAKQIMLQHEIESTYLAETENLRMKYANIVRNENDIVNLKTIYNDFEVECYKFGYL